MLRGQGIRANQSMSKSAESERNELTQPALKAKPMAIDGAASERLHYEHAPILEASLTIRIEPLPEERVETLREVAVNLGDEYKTRVDEDAKEDGEDFERRGLVYVTEDEKHIVRVMRDGVTFSRQAPYDSWERFLPEVERTWDCYKRAVGPAKVQQLEVSYVNSIAIPMNIPLYELFNTYPKLPDQDELLTELLMNYSFARSVPKYKLSVTMVWLGSRNPELPQMLLANRFLFPVDSEEQMWNLMPTVRRIKNATFESQITPRLKETFNQ